MNVDTEAIGRNGIWKLTDLPGGNKIKLKWVHNTKLNGNGEVDKYKAKLLAKGYVQWWHMVG